MALVFIICMAILYVDNTICANQETKFSQRCGNREKHQCLENQRGLDYSCEASHRNASGEVLDLDRYFCDTDCPPSIHNLKLSHYNQLMYHGGKKQFSGVNVSWTMQIGRDTAHNVLRFMVKLENDIDIMPVELNVTIRTSPRNSFTEMEFFYDCIFPVPRNKSWNVTIYTIPHRQEPVLFKSFKLDSFGNVVMTTPNPSENPPTSAAQTLAVTPTSPSPPVFMSRQQTDMPLGGDIIAFTLSPIIGCVLVILLAIGIYKYYRRQKSKTKKRVAVVDCGSDSAMLSSTAELIFQLTSICHVIRIRHISKSRDLCQTIRKYLFESDAIILISSSELFHLNPGSCDNVKSAGTPVALELMVANRNTYRAKTVTVFFPLIDNAPVAGGFSEWRPIALPFELNILLSYIDNPNKNALPRDTVEISNSQCETSPSSSEMDLYDKTLAGHLETPKEMMDTDLTAYVAQQTNNLNQREPHIESYHHMSYRNVLGYSANFNQPFINRSYIQPRDLESLATSEMTYAIRNINND